MQSQTIHSRLALKEPDWLLQYREQNAVIVQAQPLQKSKYSNIVFLERLANALVTQNHLFEIPRQLESAHVRVFSWPEALQSVEEELKTALQNECPPKDQFEAKVNAEFNAGFVLVLENPPEPIEWNSAFTFA